MKKFLVLALLTALSSPAIADETMNLFPKGRASHLEDYERAARTYEERGQAYVDDLYMYGGEGSRSEEPSLLSHDDLAGIESAPDSILSDPSNSQLLSEDAAMADDMPEPPASPE